MSPGELPRADTLSLTDPDLSQTMLARARAATVGAPDLYAESTAEFLAVHVLVHHSGRFRPPAPQHEDARIRRVLAFMQDKLHRQLTLSETPARPG